MSGNKKKKYPIDAWMTCPTCGSRWGVTFMAHDDLWKKSGLTGWPCIPCFEKAIQRRLTIQDLKPNVLCNHMLEVGWFIGDRKYGTLPTI